ncbi:MAG: glucose-6-phosphate 1-epimerase [Oleispira sp.]|jgi:glucose-6-phosphate 1-epimerase
MNYVFCQQVKIDQLEAIKIEHPLFSAILLLQGAQLIEFTPRDSKKNLLWLSDTAEYKEGKPLRGGIPICWPWFGNIDKNPVAIQNQIINRDNNNTPSAHGFARSIPWQVTSIQESCHQVKITLALTSNAESKELWPFEFNLEARFIFSHKLNIELITTNTDDKKFAISQALHTYLPTSDINKTYIHNAHNTNYIDALDNWKEKKQIGRIGFSEETDRIYFFTTKANNNPQYELRVESPGQQLVLSNTHSQSAVIWNPWIEKSKLLSQFKPEDYQSMFCIETANVMSDHKVLIPDEKQSLILELSQLN